MHKKVKSAEQEPQFMVQIADPKMLRKDILESLREVIIFMQSFEKFRQVQEEKVATILLLKDDLKELNNMANQLRRYLPRGKLRPLGLQAAVREMPRMEERPRQAPVVRREGPPAVREPLQSELDELESQLRDIERQLQKVQ